MEKSSYSGSDSDSVDEVIIRRYLKQDLKSSVTQGRALLRRRSRIKPQPGHYQVCIVLYYNHDDNYCNLSEHDKAPARSIL
jgi:hypothetical protein